MKHVLTLSVFDFSVTAVKYQTALGDKAKVSFSFPYGGGRLVKDYEIDNWPDLNFNNPTSYLIYQFLEKIKSKDFKATTINRNGIICVAAFCKVNDVDAEVIAPAFDIFKASVSWAEEDIDEK